MRIAHTGKQRLLGNRVFHAKQSGVFFQNFLQSRAQLIFISLTLGLNSHGIIRPGELNRRQFNLFIFQAQSIIGSGVSQFAENADIAPG